MLGDLTREREKSGTVGLWPDGYIYVKCVDAVM